MVATGVAVVPRLHPAGVLAPRGGRSGPGDASHPGLPLEIELRRSAAVLDWDFNFGPQFPVSVAQAGTL